MRTPAFPGLRAFAALDWLLLLPLLGISALGLLVLYSAGDGNVALVEHQAQRMALGFVVLLLIAFFPPGWLRHAAPWGYLGGVGLLLFLEWGGAGDGVRRWLDIGGLRFQPSEFMKLLVPVGAAWLLTRVARPPTLGRMIGVCLLTALPAYLVARQPDLGTALLLLAGGLAMVFLAGLSWRLLIATLAAAPILLFAGWGFIRVYQKQRIFNFFNPDADPSGSGYHLIQSKIAIGSGGMHGKGWLQGTQTHLEFVPERSTDFIFAVFCEEFGFVGAALLLTGYLFLVVRGLGIALRATDAFSSLAAAGFVLCFFFGVFINIAMNIGLLPVVGIPLPLMSLGGTASVTLLAGFGMMMALARAEKRKIS